MKNIIKISLFALAATVLSISCLNIHKYDGNDPSAADGAQIVTIVDGSYDSQYYVAFDNGQKAYVIDNKVAQSITFPSSGPMKGEVRKLIFYNFVDETREGYDYCIRIVDMQDVSTSILENIDKKEIEDQIPSHTATIKVQAATLGKVHNYITVLMHILRSNQDNFKHSIILTHNKERKGVFEETYKSTTDVDSYLWLELYHDSDTDYEYDVEELYTTYKIDTEYLGVKDMSEYKGIKIIYKDIDTKNAKVYTIAF